MLELWNTYIRHQVLISNTHKTNSAEQWYVVIDAWACYCELILSHKPAFSLYETYLAFVIHELFKYTSWFSDRFIMES